MKDCLVWCWPVALGKSLSHQISILGTGLMGGVFFCSRARSARLLQKPPDLPWGGGFSFHSSLGIGG
jgi:hypothetical protein